MPKNEKYLNTSINKSKVNKDENNIENENKDNGDKFIKNIYIKNKMDKDDIKIFFLVEIKIMKLMNIKIK